MEEEIKVDVKQEYIDDGCPCNSNLCPVAIAVAEATGIASVLVSVSYILIRDAAYDTPEEVKEFIRIFDDAFSGVNVKPFTFILKDPKMRTSQVVL